MTNAELIARYDSLRSDYADYRAEARACGYETVSFEIWAEVVPDTAKADAQKRWLDLEARDELDFH